MVEQWVLTVEPLSDVASSSEILADARNIVFHADNTFKMRRPMQKVPLPNDSEVLHHRVPLLESNNTSSPRPSGGESDEAEELEEVSLIDGLLQGLHAEELKAILDMRRAWVWTSARRTWTRVRLRRVSARSVDEQQLQEGDA